MAKSKKYKVLSITALAELVYKKRGYDFGQPNARDMARSNFTRLDINEENLDEHFEELKVLLDQEYKSYKKERFGKQNK